MNAPVEWKNVLHPREIGYYAEDQQKPVSAVSTPLESWNRHCRDAGGGLGLAHGWHIILAGATGHGKTLMALNLAAHAIRHNHDVAYVSLEMSREQLQTRVYAILSGTPVDQMERGNFNLTAWKAAQGQLESLSKERVPLLVTNTGPIRNIYDIGEQMEGMHSDMGIRVFIIDYLQLAKTGASDEELYRAISEISGTVMTFAHQHKVLTIGLSQLNRTASSNRQESPLAQGLIGSSSLENDADQVVILDHARYKRDDVDGKTARTFLILAKNRHGSSGSIPIEWDYRTLRVREAMDDELSLWPNHRQTQ